MPRKKKAAEPKFTGGPPMGNSMAPTDGLSHVTGLNGDTPYNPDGEGEDQTALAVIAGAMADDGGNPGGLSVALTSGLGQTGGMPKSEAEMFITTHADDKNRIWTETLFRDERHMLRNARVMAGDMYAMTGRINRQRILVLIAASQPAVKGIGREQALKALTMGGGRQAMQMRQAMQRLMGGGRGGQMSGNGYNMGG